MGTWQEALRQRFPRTLLDEPMSRHTTFRIGGPADAYVQAVSLQELRELVSFARSHDVPVFLLGRGSNLLILDGGIRGIVLRLSGEFSAIRFAGLRVWAGAGARLPALVLACAEAGLAGAEPLAGIPGTVGGALVMNAGTREGEIGDIVRSVRVFDGMALEEAELGPKELRFGYRSSNLENRLILGATLELKRGSKVDILRRIHELQQKRLQTQPVHTYNVGSTFKNPPGRFVAKLIEEAGLKGLRCGGVAVSEKHANFIENDRNGTAKDVLALVELLRARVRERFGVELELEMKVAGEA